MDKLLAIIKREYIQRVRSRMFLVWTILGPLMLVFFSVVPAMVFGIKAGEPTRLLNPRSRSRVGDVFAIPCQEEMHPAHRRDCNM